MVLLVLAYLGGVMTIISPCILPVLPFVFARAGRPFLRNGLPMLVGMALTFVAVASLAAVGGGWAVQANSFGRAVALVLLAGFGAVLLFPSLADRLTRPLVGLGDRLSQAADRSSASIVPSLVLGVATGLLWAPCAGPILGLILTGAALHGANVQTSLALAAYAAGAATSLALALLIGGRVFVAMKRSLHLSEIVRRVLGGVVLAAVLVVAFGLDTTLLSRVSLASTGTLEQGLLDHLRPAGPTTGPAMQASSGSSATTLPVEDDLPELTGAVAWLNSPPLTAESLKGKVVLVDFWTYSCINCLRELPYVEAWAKKYRDQGLVVIGVHAPEFAFEREIGNVTSAVARLGLDFPIAIDNNYAIWRQFNNQYWPGEYFADANGEIRHHQFGEGDYAQSERVIQQLLAEAGHKTVAAGLVDVHATGAEAAATDSVQSPETYIGFARAERFISPGGFAQGAAHDYEAGTPKLNEWAVSGRWTIDGEHATLGAAGGSIVYRFHARDLHLVLGPAADGTPVHFKITIDGAVPGDNHGSDTDADGNGVVNGQRLYQLVRLKTPPADHTFEIRFSDPGVQAFAFTFG